MRAGNRSAARALDVGEVGAHVFEPLHACSAFFGKNLHKLGIVLAAAALHCVFNVKLDRVLNAFLGLFGRARGVVAAGSEHRVAACVGVLFNENDLGAGTLGGDGSIETRGTGTDHKNVDRFAGCSFFSGSRSLFVDLGVPLGFFRCIGKRHLEIECVAVVADELRLGMPRMADRAVDGAAIAQVAGVRIEVLFLIGKLLVVAVAGHALAVQRNFVVGDGSWLDFVGAVAGNAAAEFAVEGCEVLRAGQARSRSKGRRKDQSMQRFHHGFSPWWGVCVGSKV